MRHVILLLSWAVGVGAAGHVEAQGLVWNLPADGAWVRYEGTYKQTVRRPDATEGDLTLTWFRRMEIKSVGQEDAEHDLDHDGFAVTEPCRWLEFKIATGPVVEGEIDSGPGGLRIYRVLVPESYIDGDLVDKEGIFLSYLPVVRGVRKIGDEPAQTLESEVLQIYPNLSLLRHFRELQPEGGEQPLDVPSLGSVRASGLTGTITAETVTSRSTNESTFWRSEDMPFGVVRWKAVTTNEQKNPTDLRSAFTRAVVLEEEMSAVATGTGAQSDLAAE